jgi:hypothetical protein
VATALFVRREQDRLWAYHVVEALFSELGVEGGVGVGLVGHGAKQAVAVVADLLDQQALAQHQPLEILLLVGLCVVCRVRCCVVSLVVSLGQCRDEGGERGDGTSSSAATRESIIAAWSCSSSLICSLTECKAATKKKKTKKKKTHRTHLIAGRG